MYKWYTNSETIYEVHVMSLTVLFGKKDLSFDPGSYGPVKKFWHVGHSLLQPKGWSRPTENSGYTGDEVRQVLLTCNT